MKRTVFGLITLLALARPAAAQSYDHLIIDVSGSAIQEDGGERRSAGFYAPVNIGQPRSGGLAKMPDICGFASASRVEAGAVAAWTATVTPLRVKNDAVTFRFEWTRVRDHGRDADAPGGDTELTLRPGQSLPIDIFEVPPTGTNPVCNFKRAVMRVSVDYGPSAQDDSRVIAADLWLVQKLGTGSGSEQVEVRGQPHRPMPFYFRTVTDKGVSLDLFGQITVHPRDGFSEVSIETRSRLTEGGRTTQDMPANVPGRPGLIGLRKVEQTIQMKPGEVVSVELPRLTENASGAFANQTLSITIRERQIR